MSAWSFSINHGPDGEAQWANLTTPTGEHVANIRTHHASVIASGMNDRDVFLAALRAQELAENENANCPDCQGEGNWAECGRCSELFGHAIDLRHSALGSAAPRLRSVK